MKNSRGFRLTGSAIALVALAACGGKQDADQAAVEIRGTQPSALGAPQAAQAAPAPAYPSGARTASGEGIVSYDGYQAAVARQGDTVSSLANRIGLSATELGAYNGLQPDHPLQKGDELVLPTRPGGYVAAPQAVAQADPYAAQGQQYASQYPTQYPAGGSGVTSMDLAPLPGAAVAPAAEAAPVATTPPGDARGAGWSPDLAAAAIDRAATGIDDKGQLQYPPSSTEPLPPNPTPPQPLTSPQLSQYQTPELPPTPRPVEEITTQAEQTDTQLAMAAPVPAPQAAPAEPKPQPAAPAGRLRLIQPVSGVVVIGFRQGGGRAGNDGIDYASPANSPVVAAADGTVALVSKSLGGLGNIVLIRHPGDYLTVYGRIDGVLVQKGDIVSQGQRIGVVAGMSPPRMHFEVRQGAESLDPTQFFN